MENMVMQTDKCLIKKDDKVKIIAGKDKGKIGKVLKVVRKKDRLLIENVNIVTTASKSTLPGQTSSVTGINFRPFSGQFFLQAASVNGPRLRLRLRLRHYENFLSALPRGWPLSLWHIL